MLETKSASTINTIGSSTDDAKDTYVVPTSTGSDTDSISG